jgi:thymidylate synthase
MHQYLEILTDILQNGTPKGDRTKTGTLSLFGVTAEYDLTGNKMPLLTTKKIFYNSFIHETLWFLSGSTNIKYLKDRGVSIWDSWVDPDTAVYENGKLVSGSIGKAAYGALWRNWDDVRVISVHEAGKYIKRGYEIIGHSARPDNKEGDYVVRRKIDQIKNAIELIKTNPDSRRIIVTAWNPGTLEDAVLPPCHTLFQFWTREKTTQECVDYAASIGKLDELNSTFLAEVSKGDKSLSLGSYARKFLKERNLPTRYLRTLLYCRSQDYPVGTPFNVAQYALLTHMIAQVTGTEAERLTWVGGDTHVYAPQIELAEEQVTRLPSSGGAATVVLNKEITDIDAFKFEDIQIVGYDDYYPAIKYPVAV